MFRSTNIHNTKIETIFFILGDAPKTKELFTINQENLNLKFKNNGCSHLFFRPSRLYLTRLLDTYYSHTCLGTAFPICLITYYIKPWSYE
jgi:hypothetical protein